MKSITKYKYIVILSAAVLVTGCGVVTKKYKSKELSQEQSDKLYRDQQSQDTVSMADLKWKEVFSDPHLQQLIEEGLANNYDLKNSILNIAQAEASFRQSKLAFLPSLSFVPQVTHNKSSQQALNFPSNVNINLKTTTVQLGFATNWEIDVWGKLSSAKRAALANYLQLDATKRAVETSLIATIATSYYTLLALDKQLKITEETILIREKSVKALKALNEAGNVTGADVVQSEASLYAAKVTIPELKQSIREMENQICLLTGKMPKSVERGIIDDQHLDLDLKLGVPMLLLKNRPDVEAAEMSLRQAYENTNVAKAQFYPSLTITSASGGISALTTRDLFSNSVFYNIVAGITQPIFNRGQIRTNYKIAKAKQEQAFNTFEKSLLTAGIEVSDALYAYEISKEKQETRKLQVEALEKAVRFNMRLLEFSSNTNYTDVLTSEQSLITSQLSEVNDQLLQLKATINLYRALGGGWK